MMLLKPDRIFAAYLAIYQGIFYLATGVWPLVSAGTFQKVTGPKVDLWLVKTVGVLVGLIGALLAWVGFRREVSPEIALLGAGSAAGLAGVDIVYVSKGRISPVYLLDALVEVGIIGAWAAAFYRQARRRG